MVDVVWSDDAMKDLSDIKAYIGLFDRNAADRIADQLTRVSESLSEFPHRGRPAPGGAREMVSVQPYILRYVVDPDRVTIIRVRHSARQPPDQ